MAVQGEHLKLLEIQLIVEKLIQIINKAVIKVCITGPLWWGWWADYPMMWKAFSFHDIIIILWQHNLFSNTFTAIGL